MSTNQKKKKILFVITKSNWGGAQRYVYDVATHLPKDSFDVIVAHGGSGELAFRLKKANVRTIKIERLGRDIKLFDELKVFRNLVALYRKEQPDIVHLNSSKIGVLGSLAGRVVHINRIIFTAHGWAFNEERGKLSKLLISFFSWLTIILSHKVIAVSYHIAEQVIDLPFAHKKIHIIHNAVEQFEILDRRDARTTLRTRTAYSISENLIWIGTIAELHTNKGLKYAIEACSTLDRTRHDFIYIIIGDGEKRAHLEQLIKDIGLERQIVLAGHIPDAKQYLSAFDIFILPSLTESLGYSILEAGEASLPVVTSRVGGIPEIIEHNVTGLLTEAKDTDAIKETLETLMHDERLRRELGERLHKKIRSEFSISKMLSETQAVYWG